MIKSSIVDFIASIFKKNKIKDYPTAKYSSKDLEEADILLKKVEKAKTLQYGHIKRADVIDIIAYLKKYSYIELKSDNKYSDEYEKASASFAAVPWMAQKNDKYYTDTIKFMKVNEIIEINEKGLVIKGEIAYYPKIRLTEIKAEYDEVCDYIEIHKGCNIILKMSVFHARSFTDVNGRNRLLELIKQNPNLKIKILCVGKHSGKVAWEGADRKQLNNAVLPGMLKLYKLAYWHRNQVKIRIVRDKEADTALRCTIVHIDGKIKKCYLGMWKYGWERANYGKKYKVDNDSSLALQVNQLFDDAFERAIPAKRNFEWFLYWFKKGFKFICMLLILTALQYLMLERTGVSAGEDSNNALVIFFSLTITIVVERIISGLGERFGN